MRKTIFVFLWFFSLLPTHGWTQGTRRAVWAGKFYDGRAEVLDRQIKTFLENTDKKNTIENPVAIIVPHAGYIYSGQIASFGYNLVRKGDYRTVVIIGTSHRFGFQGCSIYPSGGYESPFGKAPIDEDLASDLMEASGFKYIPEAHREEHSVEVQIPFIQKVLPNTKIVPIVMGIPSKKTISTLTGALLKCLSGKKVLIIASTDMSHYLSKKDANDLDSKTLSLIKSFKTETLIKKLENRENIMCGGGPVVSALLFAQKMGDAHIEVMRYADSSHAGGSEAGVVGYMAAALYSKPPVQAFSLSSKEKKELLQLADKTINLYIREKKIFTYHTENSNLLSKRGAFVTLKKNGLLRGCIGFIEPIYPLFQTIIQATIYASSKDMRFPPVTMRELKELKIEISVLTPIKKIEDPSTVKVGKHGLIISMGNKKGLLLPQVPLENNWSQKTFIQQACLKAGLPKDAWKSGAEIYVFEAIVFH